MSTLQFRCIGLIALAAMLCGCPQSLMPDPNIIGWMRVDGPEGYRNGQLVQGVNIKIFSGDHVSTGKATGIQVRFRGRGDTYIQLDENTDPDLIKEAGCLWVRLLKGKLFAQGTGLCLDSPDLAAAVNSQVNLEIQPSKRGGGITRSVLTVIEGHAMLSRPESIEVGAGEQIGVSEGRGVEPVRALSMQELRQVTEWRYQHRRLILAKFVPIPIPTPDTNSTANDQPTPPPPAVNQPPPVRPGIQALRIYQPQGWCCVYAGEVRNETSASCAALKGTFYADEQTARASCPAVQ